ncbi:MAG TPA: arsenic metallochaperone ArsD family protein [Bryobacteraceae bacterium]|nr:arsenic metallochaperone ArsD family protein [Bryobacteraceae bacterium]
MKKVEVFDPPMCCSTGVCGPNVDPTLVRFTADLHWLANQRVAVERSQEKAVSARHHSPGRQQSR